MYVASNGTLKKGSRLTSCPALTNVDGTWYTFGTWTGKDVRGASSTDFGSQWTRFEKNRLLYIEEATWATEEDQSLWAPDVMRRTDGKYIMYFAAHDKEKPNQHCIGGAISEKIHGPYHPVSDFVQCNRTSNGVIDPAWFKDTDGKQYVVYKTEIPANWLEVREVANSGAKEGVQWVGNAKQLLKVNGQGYSDGNNMEAPYIFKRGGVYFLTYSTHFTGDGTYDVQYATAKDVKGPYARVKEPLLKTGTKFGCKIVGPGGASFQRWVDNENTTRIIFHGLTDEMKIQKRVVYTATVHVDGSRLEIRDIDR
ncbi:hypothetical protein N0V90_002744 [Kalmusia sp. IMI 367209]|nr:hypothetical protein N0V90_002744 [Kalmusia sp. IMI 367209]